jgi:hypothetical protein
LFYSSSIGDRKEQERIKRRGRGGGCNKNIRSGHGEIKYRKTGKLTGVGSQDDK